MDTPATLYHRLAALCRRQAECLVREDLDGAERILDEQDALLRQVAEALAAAWDGKERERALAAALSALAAGQETAALLARQRDVLRDRLSRVGGGRAALRSYRPATQATTVDRYS